MLSILASNDLHGNKEFYSQIEKAALKKKITIIILSGDLLPKDGEFKDFPERQCNFTESFLLPWLEKISSLGIKTYLTIGNDDLGAVHEKFKDELARYDLHPPQATDNFTGRIINLENNYSILGFHFVTTTPFSIKDKERIDLTGEDPYPLASTPFFSKLDRNTGLITYEKIPDYKGKMKSLPSVEDLLAKLSVPVDYRKCIFVAHNPPRHGKLDMIFTGQAVGSKAIRKFVEQKKFYISLHGHIHEAPFMSGMWADNVNETLSVNPGQGKECHYVTFDLHNLKNTLWHSLYGSYNR